ncbi:Nif3-like dinuclear metal center hexameric protein [Deinococcus yavapaiensis]|uniref:Putative NIF3 family GTP cyclohydrolase 1 type 2 n=1 Tax=Deinococcus yavapaiensis KR-236 TaxID=694435 RepID=A0A318SAC5_9DEIO|nr:Nif3-like dinuclear metal center hexameric protein [Deinococcus yavapaiensis]PYE55020.1 putative NIF3 family GTP cyclohydrolase 1 type 2 [Deinococcus yavapaiensis KR-236]
MTSVHELAAWLEVRLGRDDLPTLYRKGDTDTVGVLALALEPMDVPEEANMDAVFLHRPFRAGSAFARRAILTSHHGFDEKLTTGENEPLIERLEWRDVRPFDMDRRRFGVIASPPQRTWSAFLTALLGEFGAFEDVAAPARDPLRRVALVNAFRPELVRALHDQGVDALVTGQGRVLGARHAKEVGMGIVALGHRRSEEWGLRQLGRELEQAFADLRTVVYTSSLSG